MRPTVIAGNWKMNADLDETRKLLKGILEGLSQAGSLHQEVIVCPPYTSLMLANELLQGTDLRLGAQNMSEHDDGAYTGDISWRMLKSTGCEYVILGHSERRQHHGETDSLINRKLKKALEKGLIPIVCVGESLEEREKGVAKTVITRQIRVVLDGLSSHDIGETIIAYEPVWAIGTGRTATPAQAQEVHAEIRNVISGLFGDQASRMVVIQYGGSVKPDNARELLAQPDIDGALVGGACLQAGSFLAIIDACSK